MAKIRTLGKTGVVCPPIIYGTSYPGNFVLRQFWGIILTGTIRLFGEAVQSLPSRTFVV
ncbi:hypothetical protein [Mariniphaga sediminis]|uniref:hypothetical protein n=1 Tax=Mariniphaga sediminis TaxID=1628158 RepID=UPI0035630B7D